MGTLRNTGENDVETMCANVLGMPDDSADEIVTVDDTVGGTNNSTAFTVGEFYSFISDVDCYINFGGASVSITAETASNYYLPANQERIMIATCTYLAVTRKTTSGNLFINLLNGVVAQ